MRPINKVILHCSDSDSKEQTAEMIDQWHRDRGWKKIGYHYFIRHNGLIEGGRAIEEIGSHCRDHNATSIGICLSGRNTFSSAQFESLNGLVSSLKRIWPQATVHGHNEFNSGKTCPNFDISQYKGDKQWKKPSNSSWKTVLTLLKRCWQSLGG